MAQLAQDQAGTGVSTLEPRVVCDALWGGRLPFWQPARGCGYRFNLDPILLAHFLPSSRHLIDLGAGVGVVGLLALALGRARHVTAIERQKDLAALTARNGLAQGVSEALTAITGDLRHEHLPASADLVVFNPPYFTARQGRPCQEPGRDAGRREVFGTLQDFVRCAAQATANQQGSLAAIVPWVRREELTELAAKEGMHLVRARAVCAREGQAPGHLLALASHQRVPLVEAPPLCVHVEGQWGYASEVQGWLEGPKDFRPR